MELRPPKKAVRPALFWVFIALLALASLPPVAWVFKMSITNPQEFFSMPPTLLPRSLSPFSYAAILTYPRFLMAFVNSTMVAGTTTIICLLLGSIAAYAIARLRFRFGNPPLILVLAVGFFPPTVVLASLLIRFSALGIVNEYLAMIAPYVLFALPLTIWFLTAYFRELPTQLAGEATTIGAFGRVIIPLVAPGMATAAVLTFIFAWNEYLFANTFASEDGTWPVTVVIPELRDNLAPAASMVFTLPLVALMWRYQRRVVAGPATGAIEGVGVPAARRSRERSRRIAFGAAAGVLLLVQGSAMLLFVRHGWNALAFPYPLNYGEGPLLDQVVRLAGFEDIYQIHLTTPPYVITNYPPLYMLIQAPLVWMFGPALWYGRLISLVSTAAVALLIAMTLRALTGDRVGSAAGGLTFPAIPYVLHWSSLARVDSLGLALSWAGLFVVARWPEKRWSLLTTALLLTAAIYTRQTFALAAPLAAFVWLLSRRPRRRAFVLAGIVGGLCLGLFAILNVLTGGGFFFNTVTCNLNEFRWGQVGFGSLQMLVLLPFLLLGGGAFLLLAPWKRVRSWWLVGPYLVGGACSALLIGKVGSDVNYLLELSAALSLAAGALIAWQRRRPRLQTALIFILAIQILALVQSSQIFYSDLQAKRIGQREEIGQLTRIIHEAEGPVLADEYMGLLPLDGRRIQHQTFEMTQLSRDGRWDQRPIVRGIDEQRFPVILIWQPPYAPGLRYDRWTTRMLDRIDYRYKPVDTVADTVVYRPR
jgi:ABC-type glycerol-3-phosphate transport system permease component